MPSEQDQARENPYEPPLCETVVGQERPQPGPLAPSRRDWVLAVSISLVVMALLHVVGWMSLF